MSPPRGPQGFVGGGRHHMTMRNRIAQQACGDETRWMGNISQQERSDFIGYFTEFCEINVTRIGRSPAIIICGCTSLAIVRMLS